MREVISKWCWRDWAVCGVISVCLLWILWPFQENHREPPGRSQCLSNLKQTATATSIYMSDHEERMPLANWMTSMMPYIKQRIIMECPLVIKNGKHFGYALKLSAVGIDATKVQEPALTVMHFETDALGESVVANLAARCARHGKDGSIVSFIDTHAAFKKLHDPTLE